ncbi:MAG TPA: hypothetical protein VN522_14655 [Solirubrobacterales bacterium]|nr:hypothetical protein [Solirubrobacterales bacterium]
MPYLWRIGMVVLVVCLVASMVIAVIRLSTTPEQIIGDGFHGLPHSFIESHRAEYGSGEPSG